MEDKPLFEEHKEENAIISINKVSEGGFLLIDITLFASVVKAFFDSTDKKIKKRQVDKLLGNSEWVEHYINKKTNRKVLSESFFIEHKHELETAIKLTEVNYDVIFAPRGLFKRDDKKFDVFLLREHILLKADLKTITSKNPDTIARRIKDGSDQASKIILDIRSDVSTKTLIDGLRSGSTKNALLQEILLFNRNKFYVLSKKQILGKNIYSIIK